MGCQDPSALLPVFAMWQKYKLWVNSRVESEHHPWMWKAPMDSGVRNPVTVPIKE
jgi:hypothetical protein